MNLKDRQEKLPPIYSWLSLLVLLITAHFSDGFYHADEHYQILEFGNYILGNTNEQGLCWEFGAQIRPSLQPYIVAGSMKFLNVFGITNPHYCAEFLRLTTAIITWVVMKKGYSYFMDLKVNKKVLLLTLPFLWLLIYVGVRFSSETWSALFFMLALLLWNKKRNGVKWLLLVGVLAGLSFQFRYQTIFMTFGFACWLLFVQKETWDKILVMLGGFTMILLIGVAIDSQFYGELVFAPYNYFAVNLLENKASSFGTHSWYYYFPKLLSKTYFIYGFLVLLGMIISIIKNPKTVVNFIVIPFLLIHVLISHKEIRFLIPVIFFVPYYVSVAITFIAGFLKPKFLWLSNTVIWTHIALNGLLLIMVMFYTYRSTVRVTRYLYGIGKENVLYVFKDNPYDTGMIDTFYRDGGAPTVIQVEREDQIVSNDSSDVYVFINDKNIKRIYNLPVESDLVFQTMPTLFTFYLNVNNWTDRTTIGRLHKLN